MLSRVNDATASSLAQYKILSPYEIHVRLSRIDEQIAESQKHKEKELHSLETKRDQFERLKQYISSFYSSNLRIRLRVRHSSLGEKLQQQDLQRSQLRNEVRNLTITMTTTVETTIPNLNSEKAVAVKSNEFAVHFMPHMFRSKFQTSQGNSSGTQIP